MFKVPATLTPVPVIVTTLLTPVALIVTLPFAVMIFTLLFPLEYKPIKVPAVILPAVRLPVYVGRYACTLVFA